MSNFGKPYLRPDSRGDQYPMVETGKHHCLTPRCRGVVHKKNEHSPFCHTCRWKKKKEGNPAKYAFGNLRRRAKQRGKSFELTFEEYLIFIKKTNYLELKGKTGKSLSIDRIDNSKGYSFANIRAISLVENSRKGFVDFYRRQQENEAYVPSAEELAEVSSKMSIDD